jgi:predicted AlkP superfamily pyrophosphatase or phosphodiesterase
MLHRTAHVPQAGEIADNPQVLYDHTIPVQGMSLHGIKLGDPSSAIATWRVDHERDNWIVCDDGSRYRIEDKKIATLGVWDNRILSKLDIHSPDDIAARFGKPEKTDQIKDIYMYRYDDGRITVIWNKFEGQIDAVNVRASASN